MRDGLHVIMPYRQGSAWLFDDLLMGLQHEPFVSSIPDLIETLVRNVPNPEKGFRMLFASEPFSGYQVELVKIQGRFLGRWYRWADRDAEGSLFPALFFYFPKVPTRLYVRVEPL